MTSEEYRPGSWEEHRREVISTLNNLRVDVAKVDHKIDARRDEDDATRRLLDTELGKLRDRITVLEVTLKFKAGLWGAVAASLPVAGFIVWKTLAG